MKANHKKYFDYHPKVDVFYFTKDGLAFTNKGQAEQHQKTLTGKTKGAETVKRNEKVEKQEIVEGSEKTLDQLETELAQAQRDLASAEDNKDIEALELKIVEIEVAIENLN